MAILRTRISRFGPAFAALVLLSCSPDVQTEYTADTRDGFFAACLESVEDSFLQARLCQCVFDTAALEIPYERFAEIDEELTLDPLAPLPAELTAVIAECVIEEADL